MKTVLTQRQIRRLASIVDDVNQVCIGSVVLPPIILSDTINIRGLAGFLVAITGVWISLRLERISEKII